MGVESIFSIQDLNFSRRSFITSSSFSGGDLVSDIFEQGIAQVIDALPLIVSSGSYGP